MLLLGTGESGKSTFAKQMRILHLSGFDAAARKTYRSVVRTNVVDNMLMLLDGASSLGIQIENKQAAEAVVAKVSFLCSVL
jgi:guanine nucleotide-binding protein G(i) subunit alpha